MSTTNATRRRSMSVSASPYLSQSDTTFSNSSSLWSSNGGAKSYFLSRFKSPSTTPPISPSSSTSTSISTLPPINGQQNIKRKPIVNPTPSTSTTKKKYEAVLGINTDELLLENVSSKKKSNSNRRFVGNLFKKKQPRSRSVEKKIDNRSDIIVSETVELPPLQFNNASIKYLSNYKPQYHQYEVKEQPSLASRQPLPSLQPTLVSQQLPPVLQQQQTSFTSKPTTPEPVRPARNSARWSDASTRKSTGSNSIYSTFGSEFIYEGENSTDNITAATSVADIHEGLVKVNTNESEMAAVDLAHIVANNVQTRNPARLVSTPEDSTTDDYEEEEEEEDEDDDDDEDEDEEDEIKELHTADEFVDATGVSQEDLERERIEARLSKRLSGGHFGSAGGLMVSIMTPTDNLDMTKKQKRRSRPPPEDVVQSMMNWKRQSGKFMLEQQQSDKELADKLEIPVSPPLPPPTVPQKDINQYINKQLPQRPLPSYPEILLSPTEEGEEGEEEVETDGIIIGIEEPPSDSVTSNDPKDCASRLWHEDETFVQRERIAEWLGQSKPLNMNTLQEYMEYFEFATMRLDSAFRKVCSKLYFRAEAQQIDRILEAFAKRYWNCNPQTIFGNADTVYAVVYSLLLLNTDLHVAQGSYTRMTRQAFVKNTMSTILDQQKADPNRPTRTANNMLAWEAHIEAYLKDMYISVKNYQILQPSQNQQEANNDLNSDFLYPTPSVSKRMSMIGGKRMIDIKRSLNTMIHKSGSTRESMLFLDDPSPRKSTSSSSQNLISPNRTQHPYRRGSISSAHSANSSGILTSSKSATTTNGTLLSPNHSHMMSFMDTHAADLFANRPPYLKEGVVMRKHLLESANQKAKHREWRECLLVVGQGELKMYGLQSDNNDSYGSSSNGRRNMIRQSSASFANLADSLTKSYSNGASNSSVSNVSTSFSGVSHNSNHRWAAYSQLLGTVELNHSLSNALPPPGYNRTRPHVFAIQEPNGGVHLIQAASQEQVNEWVSSCNYWAARQSKEPLQGGVSNIEYGWGSCLDDVILDLDAVESGKKITGKYFRDPDAVIISNWVPPAPTMVSSILDEVTHFNNLEKYLVSLNQEINDHREIKKKILVKFPYKSQNHSKALSNWEAKSKYMLHEIIKYQNYCDVLEKSIQRQESEENERGKQEES